MLISLTTPKIFNRAVVQPWNGTPKGLKKLTTLVTLISSSITSIFLFIRMRFVRGSIRDTSLQSIAITFASSWLSITPMANGRSSANRHSRSTRFTDETGIDDSDFTHGPGIFQRRPGASSGERYSVRARLLRVTGDQYKQLYHTAGQFQPRRGHATGKFAPDRCG